MRRELLILGGLLQTALVGCTSVNDSGDTNVACRPLTVTSAVRPPGWSGTVFTIVMENHASSEIFGNGDAPFIKALAAQNAVAGGYHDDYVHPSEPNYIWMTAGENFGVLNDNDPGPSNTISSTSHIADQIERAGLTWKAYAENMGQPCGLVSSGNYAPKHVPFVYFDDINGWNGSTFDPPARCAEHVVDYSALAADLAQGTLPDYVFITPDLNDDMHNGTVAEGDAWLAALVPTIQASKAYLNGGVIFLLWDEGSNSGDNPPFLAISPNAKHGYTSQVSYDTSAYLLTVERLLGVDALPCVSQPDAVEPMSDLFTVPLSVSDAGP